MTQSNGRISCIDMLSAWTAGAEGIHLALSEERVIGFRNAGRIGDHSIIIHAGRCGAVIM